MRKIASIAVGIAAVVALCAYNAYTARGQVSGTAQMNSSRVSQGSTISMTVSLDKAPNFPGVVRVTVSPEGENSGSAVLTCSVGSGQNSCDATAWISLEAKLGRWSVSEISFQPTASDTKVLNKQGALAFEVVPHGAIVLPDSATISDIK